jgi:hypothetical protein
MFQWERRGLVSKYVSSDIDWSLLFPEAKLFFLLARIQTGSGAHLAFY